MKALILALCLTAAVTGQAEAETGHADIHTVAVIVALGRSAEYLNEGTFFSTGGGTIDIAPLKLDEAVVRDVTALLNGRFAVLPAIYDHSAFTTMQEGFFGSEIPIADMLGNRADRKSVDAYIVIYPETASNALPFNAGGVRGASLVRRSQSEIDDCAFYKVAIFDSRTVRPVAETWLSLGETRDGQIVPAWRAAPVNAAPESYSGMTDDQRQAFRDRLGKLVGDSLKPTLTALGLLP